MKYIGKKEKLTYFWHVSVVKLVLLVTVKAIIELYFSNRDRSTHKGVCSNQCQTKWDEI